MDRRTVKLCLLVGVFVVISAMLVGCATTTCPVCHGASTGSVIPCKRCDGSGKILDKSTVTLPPITIQKK